MCERLEEAVEPLLKQRAARVAERSVSPHAAASELLELWRTGKFSES